MSEMVYQLNMELTASDSSVLLSLLMQHVSIQTQAKPSRSA